MKSFLAELALILASIACALALVMAGLWIARYPAHLVILEWARGTTGWPLNFTRGLPFDIAVDLKNACPLIFTGLAVGIAFRCGVINIGGEGQVLAGGVGSITFATFIAPGLPAAAAIPLTLAVGALAGGAWALIAALLDRFRGVPIVLSTILLNFIALKCTEALLEGPLKDPATGVPQSKPIPAAFHLPEIPGMSTLHAGIFIAIGVALLAWVLQSRTVFGYELRVTGLNPVAARLAGIPVAARQLGVMTLSGAFAGLAGAVQLMGITHVLGTRSPEIGYAGIAVALLGRLHPAGIVLAAIFFGMLDHGATSVEISRYALPHDVSSIVKGIIVLGILIGTAFVARRRSIAGDR